VCVINYYMVSSIFQCNFFVKMDVKFLNPYSVVVLSDALPGPL
jgi:hypothetical protein